VREGEIQRHRVVNTGVSVVNDGVLAVNLHA
jgi:hypothetical protein